MNLLKSLLKCSIAGATAVSLLAAEGEASAQTAPVQQGINPEGKGIVGTALLGGEVVITIMGAAGLRDWWPYLVFGGLGAVGGGIGGWAIDNEVRSPELSIGLLAGGLVMLIPSTVVMVNALSQSPPEVQKQKQDEGDPAKKEPAPQPQQPGQPPAKAGRPRLFPGAMLGLVKGEVLPGVPAVGVGPLYTQRQIQTYGVEQGVEVKLPVFEARF